MTEYELRASTVDAAMGWMGCREADGSHEPIVDLYNSHKPLARGYAVKYTDAWCATFVSAVAVQCGLTAIIPTECSCPKQVALFQELGRWQEEDDYVPRLGDIIYYDWEDDGQGDNLGSTNHVGIVTNVAGGMITVIEGNKGNAVAMREIAVGGKYIRGYGCPDYASGATEKASDWAENAWYKAEAKGILDGTSPQGTMTREMAAVVLERLGLLD